MYFKRIVTKFFFASALFVGMSPSVLKAYRIGLYGTDVGHFAVEGESRGASRFLNEMLINKKLVIASVKIVYTCLIPK